jgi:hypothetical protein
MRGDQQAQGASGQANANANTFMGNSNSLYGDLAPSLESTMANPQGFSPRDEAAMETGAQQSAGGSEAAAVGQGALQAARTGNTGAASRAVADASRGAGENLSRNLLGIRTANANLKQHQRDEAQSGLEGLYGTNVSGQGQALGNVAANSNANTNAINASWDWSKDLLAPVLSAAGSAAAGAGY